MRDTRECPRGAGCGQIDDGQPGDPWKYWQELPPGSNIAVVLGIVKPIACPECKGSGQRGESVLQAEEG